MMQTLSLENGKYELRFDEASGALCAYRYGEPWQDFTGNKFIYLLMQAALAAAEVQPVGEPVAWGQLGTLNGRSYLRQAYDRTPYPPSAGVARELNLVPLYAAPPAQPAREPDMRHPKIQALIGSNARKNIEMRLIEQVLADPNCDLTSLDMEYWNSTHDKLREKLLATTAREPLTDEQARDLVKECGLDWQRGYMPLFDDDPTNRYEVLIREVERRCSIGSQP